MNIIKIVSIILLCISVMFFSCSEDTPTKPEKNVFDIQGETGFMGTVNGTDAFVMVMIFPAETIAYVCNGDEEILEWFWAVMDDPAVINMTSRDGAQISAQFEGNSFKGEVTFKNGYSNSFTATTSDAEDIGLFLVVDDQATLDEVEAGWIVNPEGEVRGALRISSLFQSTPTFRRSSLSLGNKSYNVIHVVTSIDGRWGKAG